MLWTCDWLSWLIIFSVVMILLTFIWLEVLSLSSDNKQNIRILLFLVYVFVASKNETIEMFKRSNSNQVFNTIQKSDEKEDS